MGTIRPSRRPSHLAVPLNAEAARAVYDRIGRLQDSQRFYEDAPVARLIALAELAESRSVFELGCGTGRLAARLLDSVLPGDATYHGVDLSPKMVSIAAERLDPWKGRAKVDLVDPPAVTLPAGDATADAFVSTYVYDLLEAEVARALLGEAARILSPGGRLALVSLTDGTTTMSRLVARTWSAVGRRWPQLVGGCHPVELSDLVTGSDWTIEHQEVVVRFGVPSEVLVARRRHRNAD